MYKKVVIFFLILILSLLLLALLLSIWLPIAQSLRIVFGAVYLLFLPGFIWSHVFWKGKEINYIERFILSLALSIALVPLTVFVFNKIGLRVNVVNSFLEIFGIIVAGIIALLIKNKLALKKQNQLDY
jgi:uncharacterized membrane protein